MKKSDVVVLGGGPGGYAAAFEAADRGLSVSLIDIEPNPGGVCLYRGCIPSKALLHVAKVLTDAREAEYFGIKFDSPRIDLDRLRESKNEIIEKLTSGLGQLAKARKINYVEGRGNFEESTRIRVTAKNGSEQYIEPRHTILASGSRPATLPSITLDSPRIMNSTSALEVESIPENLLCIGGGYIGLELATVYATLGSQVTIVEMLPKLLMGADADLVKVLHERMSKICHAIHTSTKVVAIKEDKKGLRVTLENADGQQRTQTFDKVLVSVGRKPNSSGLGLQSTKVEVDDRGFVKVDAQMRTADPHILAIGDVVGNPMLAHKASHEGRIAAEVLAGMKSAFQPNAIPAVVFTDPELAWVGITETEAREKKIPIQVARFPWSASGRATTLHRSDGLTKIITDPDSRRILGVGIVGPSAGELISQGTLAIEMGALASDVEMTIHPHPTLSETVMETAELIFGQGTHMYQAPRTQRKEAGAEKRGREKTAKKK